jgi:hypothetical protein
MATDLDRTLDDILADKKSSARRNKGRNAPTGGVKKRSARIENNRKKSTTAAPAQPAAKPAKKTKTDTKIVVSNLVSFQNAVLLSLQ